MRATSHEPHGPQVGLLLAVAVTNSGDSSSERGINVRKAHDSWKDLWTHQALDLLAL